MQRSVPLLFLIAVSCIAMGCAHTDGISGPASQQQGAAASYASGGVPSLEMSETSYDFGKVKDTQGEVVHEFILKNVGTGVLTIKKVLPG